MPAHLRDVAPLVLTDEAEACYERCLANYADVPLIGYAVRKAVGALARGARRPPAVAGRPAHTRDRRHGRCRRRHAPLRPPRQADRPGLLGRAVRPVPGHRPVIRALLMPEAQAKAPCVVLEVNTDGSRNPVRKAMAAGEITWPCWFDGRTTGPITMAWNAHSFPLIHIIDAEGVLRGKDGRGPELAAAVARIAADGRTRRP